jgi:hypothetical protein
MCQEQQYIDNEYEYDDDDNDDNDNDNDNDNEDNDDDAYDFDLPTTPSDSGSDTYVPQSKRIRRQEPIVSSTWSTATTTSTSTSTTTATAASYAPPTDQWYRECIHASSSPSLPMDVVEATPQHAWSRY